jgi:HK97 family phage prohead protease
MARYNHELLLGTTAAQSLRLNVDGTGLDYEVDLLADSDSERVRMLVERGDVTRSSFAAYMHESEWSQTHDGFPLRTVMSMTLVDVAPVDDPAYYDTSTGLRSLAEQRGMDLSEVEALAREERLNEILAKPPTVIDLGTRDSEPESVGETCAPGRLLAMRRALEIELAD